MRPNYVDLRQFTFDFDNKMTKCIKNDKMQLISQLSNYLIVAGTIFLRCKVLGVERCAEMNQLRRF